MTPQEQQMLDGLIGRVQSTQLAGKDPEAQQRIQSALGNNSDALYILCQTVLVQSYALDNAQKQLSDARQQLTTLEQKVQDNTHPGFLEKIFGSSRDTQPAATQQQAPSYSGIRQGTPAYGTPAYSGPNSAPGYGSPYPPPPPPPGYGYGAAPVSSGGGMFGGGGFGGGGFLQGAMQTAAGVAMGTMAVQGVESLLHGFGHQAGYGSDRADRALGGFGDDNSRNFADNSGGTGDDFGDRLQTADNAGPGLSSDIEDRRGASGFFGGNDSGDDTASGFTDIGDDSGNDDSFGSDDSGSFDDSSSGSDDSY